MSVCGAVRELLAAHALGALDPSAGTLVRDHLRGCARCRAAETETRACLALVAAPPVAPPAELWDRIRLRVARSEAADPVRGGAPDLVIALSCSFCRGGLVRDEAVYCASCLAPHHPDCFRAYGRCSVMGCGEPRVVRPSELPRGAERRPVRAAPEELGSRRRPRRWRIAGLGAALAGAIGAAAALAPRERGAPASGEWALRPVVAPGEPALRLELRDATLGELVAELEALTGVEVELGRRHASLLIRQASWAGAEPWPGALERLCRTLGLELYPRQGGGWTIAETTAHEALAPLLVRLEDLPAGKVASDRTLRLVGSIAHDSTVLEGWRYRLLPAPELDALAVIEPEGGLGVYAGGIPWATLPDPGALRATAWDGARFAYLAGRGEELELGVLTVGSQLTRPLARPLQLTGERAGLAWLDPDTLLAWDADAVQLVPALRSGEPLTLASPSPRGFARFALHPLDDQRVLVERPGGLELWRLRPAPERLGEPLTLPYYRVEVARGAGLAMVQLGAEVRLIAIEPERLREEPTPLASREPGPGAWHASLSPSGAHLAYLNDGELLVRRTAAHRGAFQLLTPGLDGEVRGFAWRPDGKELAFWSGRTCYVAATEELLSSARSDVFKRAVPRFEASPDPAEVRQAHALARNGGAKGRMEPSSWIHDVTWADRSLLVTVRAVQPRRPRIELSE